MQNIKQKIINSALTMGAVALGLFGIGIATANAAQAATINCGSIQCTVGSQQGATGSETPTPGNTGGGGNGGGGDYSDIRHVWAGCEAWYGGESGGWLGTSTYATTLAQGEWTCRFEQRMSDVPKNLPSCKKTADGRVAYGKYDAFSKTTGEFLYFFCVYPTAAYLTPTVTTIVAPLGGQGDFYHVGSAGMTNQYGTSGTKADSTGYRTTSFNRAAPSVVSLDQNFNAKTLVINGQPSFGFYRLQWKVDMTEYRRSIYPAWLGKQDTFVHIRDYTNYSAGAYTYGCNMNPALVAGVRNDAIFDPSECARTTWQCDIRGEITQLGTAGYVQVMRDGSHIPVTFPTFGVVGNGVRNVTKQQTYTGVDTNAVSPVNGVGSSPDDTKQYFQSSWKWNSWQAYEPTKEKWIAFYWASENGKTFSYNQQFRFTGEFYVPAQGSIGGGSAYRWVTDTTDCGVTKQSAQVEVLRAAGSK